jgi:cytochrome c-type biogenesis protein CcsB
MKFLILNDYQFPFIASFLLFLAMINNWISLSALKQNPLLPFNKILLIISNLIFIVTLLLRWVGEGYFPLSNLYESLIFLAWAISSIELFIEYKTKSRLLSSIICPIIFFISSFSSLTLPIEMQKAIPLVPSLQSNWLMMHVSMMMISYATLIVGSLLSILYLTFSSFLGLFSTKNLSGAKNITSNQIALTDKLTSQASVITQLSLEKNQTKDKTLKNSILETLDTWSYRIIGLGFPFLTIGIISGAVWANEAWGSYWSWDPKETWALITWLVFASYLHSRIIKGWEGQKTAFIGTIGFFVIWICYLGVNFLAKGLHSYGWVINS